MKEDLIETMKARNVIYREPGMTLKAGQISDFYVDVKSTYGYCGILNELADMMRDEIESSTSAIACSGYGGLPLASAMCSRHGFRLSMIRDEPKDHGRGGFIDGCIPDKYDAIYLVDDVFTSGKSLRGMAKKLEPTGAQILGAAVVVKRGSGDLSDIGIPLKHLFTVEEFL